MLVDSYIGASDYDSQDADYYKRAVVKAAPPCFTVEVLPPAKQGKAYSHGIRIIPINPEQFSLHDRDNGSDTTSVNSLYREYEIWRRWDDCLDFQGKLEAEYERMSWDKKHGLKHGKKGSGDGGTLYRNPKAAASFESLPEGPDPKSIKVDIHAYIPRLSRKSSFFSVSDATVQKRAEEFAAMIYALFKQDCPKLIMELRDSPAVRDFFAWWRRDQDLMEKGPQRPGSAMSLNRRSSSRASVDSTVFTSPPSPDSPGFSMLKRHEKVYVYPQRSPTEASMKSPQSPGKPLPSPPVSPEMKMQRSRSPMPFRRPSTRGGMPHISRPMAHPQYSDDSLLSPPAERFGRSLSPISPNRAGRVFDPREMQQMRVVGHKNGADASSDSSSTPPTTPTRQNFNRVDIRKDRPVSQMSMESVDSADYNIDLSFITLPPPPAGRRNKRDSVMSVASVDSTRTTNSMDGVIPLRRQSRTVRGRRRRDGPWEPDSRLSVAVPEEGEYYDLGEDEFFDDTMSYLDNLDAFPIVPGDDDAQYVDYRERRMSFPASITESAFGDEYDNEGEPSSPTETIMGRSESGHSVSSMELPRGMCSVKAKYDDCIVALRLPIGTPLSTLRARLSEKFSQVQGIQLHYRFGLAYAPAAGRRDSDEMEVPVMLSPSAYEMTHKPSRSHYRRPSSPDSVYGSGPLLKLVPIWSQDDWEVALYTCNNKVILQILDHDLR